VITLLGDRYRLGERLADGGMGSVYRAVDESLGRPVAVKVLRRELADEPAFLERFRREARADLLASVLNGRSGVPARRSSWWALGAGTLVAMTPLLLALRPISGAGVDHGDEDN
jgi:hypothetical protein